MTSISYLATAEQGRKQAVTLATSLACSEIIALRRRGCHLGWIGIGGQPATNDERLITTRWTQGQPIHLPGLVADQLTTWQPAIKQSRRLLAAAQAQRHLDTLFTRAPYASALQDRFEMLVTFFDENDPQEISTIEFDAHDETGIIAENLWLKASWLSFDNSDRSVRFRFSFGLVNHEDVAADFTRELLAAALCEAIFPESALISTHPAVHRLLQSIEGIGDLFFVERIVYFNAPNGGALLHQDVERGHRGVVFAQASGRTIWFALSTDELIDAIQINARQRVTNTLLTRMQISAWLTDDEPPAWLGNLLNQDPGFAAYLVKEGHAYVLNPGDVLLLPQETPDRCAWHSVFCLGQTTGEGLSFAFRGAPANRDPLAVKEIA